MKKGLTIITRGVVYLMAISVVAVCAILLPELAREEAVGKAHPPSAYPFLIGAWILSVPIFFALQQTLKLLNYIDKNIAFSKLSIKALRNIKFSTIVFGVLIAVSTITAIIIARQADPKEDVTFIISLGFIFVFTSSIIATFVAVLQRLLHDAIAVKKENDLII
jgi:hypothetical protein